MDLCLYSFTCFSTDLPLLCCSVSVFLSVFVNIFNRGLSHHFRRHNSQRSVGFGLFWFCVCVVIDVFEWSITKPLQNHYKHRCCAVITVILRTDVAGCYRFLITKPLQVWLCLAVETYRRVYIGFDVC